MADTIRVLHAVADPSLAARTAEGVQAADDRFEVVTESTVADALDRLDTARIDCLVADADLPDGTGLTLLETVRAEEDDPSIPFVLFTKQGGERLVSDAFAAGATDYLRAGCGAEQFLVLANRISNAVEAVRARETDLERYRTIVQALGDPVYTIDADGYFTFVNDAYAELTGYDEDEIVGSHAAFIIDQPSLERSRDAIRTLLSGDNESEQEAFEIVLEASDGARIDCEDNLSLLPLDDGEFRGVAGVVRDIRDRKEREYELRRYEQMANAAADMVYVLDDEGRIEFVNDAATDLTGYDRDRLIGAHVDLFMDETDVERGRQLVRDLLADDAAHSDALEWTMHTADGDRFPCESHISLLDESAGLRGTTGVVRDVTDRKERQRELERQNERLEEFAGIVSHDLRNPLAVAQSRLELLASSVDSPHADPLATSLDRMEAIIDDTLLLARQGESVAETERVDAAAIAESSWAVVETDAATLSAESVTLDADPDRLRHVFENLFRNAIKHGTPADGDDPIADEPLRVRVERLADDTGFAVEDDGPGIPPDDRDVVFEGGYSTSADGTGFGLSIVKRIVEAHGWTVTATEGTDGGARFEITGVDSLG